MDNSFLPENVKHRVSNIISRLNKKITFYVIGLIAFLFIFYFLLLSAPSDFIPGTIVRVEPGMSLRSMSSLFKDKHIIRSRVTFEFFVIIFGGEKHIMSADYLLENKLPVWQVALRIVGGIHRLVPVSVTIPEGFSVNEIADTFTSKLTNFNKARFLLGTTRLEGYLFPDTYFFSHSADDGEVIKLMNSNFNKKITPLIPEIDSSGKSEKEIITMSSIIEGEAKGDTDRAVISGILWKRIQIGMPLQVDSAPETYKTKGLPASPIGNPGLKAIMAAIHPQASSYLYYLHDKNGNIHYAKSFAEHQANIKKYLGN